MSDHDEHRQRMKAKFRKIGLDGLEDHEALELLLFFSIPRRNVNPIAHALMNRFGSLTAVFEASIEELCEVVGVGETSALLIHLCAALFRRYDTDRVQRALGGECLNSVALMGAYMRPHFTGLRDEAVVAACVDNRCRVIDCQELARGTVGSVNVSVREIVEYALRNHSSGLILAHNHPHGNALPSHEDIHFTERVVKGLKAVEITLLDHIIIGDDPDGDFLSMRESALIR